MSFWFLMVILLFIAIQLINYNKPQEYEVNYTRFLTELNRRPHPQGVEMLIIAGIASPWSEDEIDSWIDDQSQDASEDREKSLDELGASLVSLARGVGDGLVSVESSRLEGVEHQTVDGTHMSMIRTISSDSERTPPALPIIVERLSEAEE